MTNEDREAIEQLVARFFEKSDDLIAVSSYIEAAITDRKRFAAAREAREAKEWSAA